MVLRAEQDAAMLVLRERCTIAVLEMPCGMQE